jgi:hypothetical protein
VHHLYLSSHAILLVRNKSVIPERKSRCLYQVGLASVRRCAAHFPLGEYFKHSEVALVALARATAEATGDKAKRNHSVPCWTSAARTVASCLCCPAGRLECTLERM